MSIPDDPPKSKRQGKPAQDSTPGDTSAMTETLPDSPAKPPTKGDLVKMPKPTTRRDYIDSIFTHITGIPLTLPDESYRGKTTPIDVLDWISNNVHLLKHKDGSIYVWKNGNYLEGGDEAIRQLVQVYLLEIERKDRLTQNMVSTVLGLLRDRLGYLADTPDMDLINVKNGLVNLRTKMLLPHTPLLGTTVQLPVVYDPTKKCPAWDEFLAQVLPDEWYVELAKDLFSLAMVPNTNFQKLFLLIGSGANGKSMFLQGLEAFIGSVNTAHSSMYSLAQQGGFHLHNIVGKLINICPDLEIGKLPDTNVIKMITGQDTISVNRKNRDMYDVRPFCRLFFSAPAMPSSDDDSEGWYDRIVPIRFPNRFERNADKGEQLRATLTSQDELSGMLNVAIRRWEKVNVARQLTIPRGIREDLARLRAESDTVSAFLKNRIVPCDKDKSVSSEELFAAYSLWCEERDLDCETEVWFFRRLRFKIPTARKTRLGTSSRAYAYAGITWK